MTQAIRAAVIVLLFIAVVCLIVLFARSGKAKKGKVNVSMGGGSAAPTGSANVNTSGADGAATVRRRFLIFFAAIGAGISALFVKLWSMQVISGEAYSEKAEENRTTEYTTVAPRGRIFDRNGKELVGNRTSFTVLVDSDVQYDAKVIHRLSNVLNIPRPTVASLAASESDGAQADRLIAMDVSDRAVAYISEHPQAFTGVTVEARTVRTYPNGTLAAHVLGYAGTISTEELNSKTAGITYESGDTVGKDGAEKAFESYLQGDRGVKQVEIDAAGNVVATVDSVDPVQGNDICLTIDIDVQEVAEEALQYAFSDAHYAKYENACAGAILCMNVHTGEIIAMASAPTYDSSEFVGGISTEMWEDLTSDDSSYPLSNRCIAGLYPAASTFKGFTGLAGLEYGFASTSKVWNCKGTWTGFGKKWSQKCWDLDGHGLIDFYHGIVESCDVVFYEIAKKFYHYNKNETALQDYLKSWGFGKQTGIELPGEQSGRVPTPKWKKEYNRDAPENASWLPGDISNLIIGQGDLLVTPLQIACGYAGLATGKVPKPVLLKSVLAQDGKTKVVDGAEYQGSTVKPKFKKENIHTMRRGFRGVVRDGSVKDVFDRLDIKTAGKTGTAEVAGKDNFAWYVGYGPYNHPKYVCACLVEEGGSGATSAAPAVCQVLGAALGEKVTHKRGASSQEH